MNWTSSVSFIIVIVNDLYSILQTLKSTPSRYQARVPAHPSSEPPERHSRFLFPQGHNWIAVVASEYRYKTALTTPLRTNPLPNHRFHPSIDWLTDSGHGDSDTDYMALTMHTHIICERYRDSPSRWWWWRPRRQNSNDRRVPQTTCRPDQSHQPSTTANDYTP